MASVSFTVAQPFGDFMVLQRGKPIKIWGTNLKEQQIRVSLDGNGETSIFAPAGKWQGILPPLQAGRGLTMRIRGEDPEDIIEFHDVVVGEVWVAGGQSNMEFPLAFDTEAGKVIPAADDPDMRYYVCPKIKVAGQEMEEGFSRQGFWQKLTPASAPGFTAVGYYFSASLHRQYGIPIGIIDCSWRGTVAATWLDEKFLIEEEDLNIYWREYEDCLTHLDMHHYLSQQNRGQKAQKIQNRLGITACYMKYTPGPVLSRFLAALSKGATSGLQRMGPYNENRPGGLYHTMVEKIAGYTVRGVIWYQGESDDGRAGLYARLFSAVIRCWRRVWEEDLPFLFVQLAPFEHWLYYRAENLPLLRAQQEEVAHQVVKAYMASIMDAGSRNDIHPKHKRPVGERLALLARGKVYGEPVLCEAPEVSSGNVDQNRIVITFSNVGSGLHVKGESITGLELFADGGVVEHFSICVTREAVEISAEEIRVARKIEVRFAWKNFTLVNLYNSADLPAKPFDKVMLKTS